MEYRVEVSPAAQRDLRRLPRQDLARIANSIQALSGNPRPTGIRKVRGQERTWRIRVGPYRVIYDVYDDDQLVVVLKIDRRRENTYRR